MATRNINMSTDVQKIRLIQILS